MSIDIKLSASTGDLASRASSLVARILNASVAGYASSFQFASLSLVSGLIAGVLYGYRSAAHSRDAEAADNEDRPLEAQAKLRPLLAGAAGCVVGGIAGWAAGYVVGFSRFWQRSNGSGSHLKGALLGVLMKSFPLTPPITFM
jgi:hypothetical protein